MADAKPTVAVPNVNDEDASTIRTSKYIPFPAWYYGPGGESALVDSEEDIPAGWHDCPTKAEAAAAAAEAEAAEAAAEAEAADL